MVCLCLSSVNLAHETKGVCELRRQVVVVRVAGLVRCRHFRLQASGPIISKTTPGKTKERNKMGFIYLSIIFNHA